MSRRRVSKLVAALCGLAVVAVLVLMSVYWRDLRVHYHVLLLRSDSGRLDTYLRLPDDSVEKVAFRRHLQSAGGRAALRGILVGELLRRLEKRRPEFLEETLESDYGTTFGLYDLRRGTMVFVVDGAVTSTITVDPGSRILKFRPYLELIGKGPFRLDGAPELDFEIEAYWADGPERQLVVEGKMSRRPKRSGDP
ncbi:MAG: hypothetical protein O7J95_06105 [Planctomycetota bacterium]|nr:hypothetical protein [Planctomycetota bacterium]